jgi:hypothetical protein
VSWTLEYGSHSQLARIGDPGDFRSFQTDSDGSFDYKLVRSGDYILFTADRLDLEYRNPAVVRDYLASGTPVKVQASALYNRSKPEQNPGQDDDPGGE